MIVMPEYLNIVRLVEIGVYQGDDVVAERDQIEIALLFLICNVCDVAVSPIRTREKYSITRSERNLPA